MGHVLIDPIADALRAQAADRAVDARGRDANAVVGRLLRRRAEARGLDALQLEALLHLRAAHTPRLSLHELGRNLGPGSGVAAVVSALLREGLVEPAASAAGEVGLSAGGRQLADQVLAELGVLLAYALGPVGLTPAQFAVRVRKELR
jgi:hypothetical protein